MLMAILIGLCLTMTTARGTPIGEAMHRALVAAPARRLSRITRGQVLLTLALGALALSLIWLLENDGRMIVAMGLPDVVSFAMAIDLAGLLDLFAIAAIAASTVRVRAVRAALVQRFAARRSHRRAPRVRRQRPPANDDEGRPGVAVRLAA